MMTALSHAITLILLLLSLPAERCHTTDFNENRKLTAIACDEILVRGELIQGIVITDEVWKKVDLNFQKLIDCLPKNGGTLIFNTTGVVVPSATTFIEYMTVTIKSWDAFVFNSNYNSTGKGSIVFSCPYQQSLFDIRKANVTIEDIKIQSCFSNQDPVISLKGNLIIKNSVIDNCSTEPGSSVIMLKKKSSLNLQGTYFIKNKSANLMSAGSFSNILIENCFFKNNEAPINEGMLLVYNGIIKVNQTVFKENKETLIKLQNSNLTISACAFEKNEGNNTSLIHSQVEEAGSVIYLTQSSFLQNRASGNGSVLNVNGENSFLVIYSSIFQSNYASENGGAIFVDGATVFLTNTRFTDNSCIKSGGVMYHTSKTSAINSVISVSNVVFESNMAKYGGAISMQGYSKYIELNNLYFKNNTASVNGGGIFSNSNSDMFLSNSTFKENVAESGAALYIERGDIDSRQVVTHILSSTFEYNFAKNFGGSIYITGKKNSVILFSNLFLENTCNKSGGSLHLSEGVYVLLEETVFKSNSANDTGGAVFASGTNTNTTIIFSYSRFLKNIASTDGGGVYLTGQYLNAVLHADTEFEENECKNSGGAISINSLSDLLIENVSLNLNKAKTGAAVYINTSDSSIESCSILISNTSFFSNAALTSGGSLFITSVPTEESSHPQNQNCLIISRNVNFTENSALDSGGAIYSLNTSNLLLTDNIFTRNKADNNGGAIAILSELENYLEFSISNTLFINNSAYNGGALHTQGCFKASLFKNNIFLSNSGNSGSALFAQNGLFLPKASNNSFRKNLVISENKGTGSGGGALFLKCDDINKNVIFFEKSEFVYNRAIPYFDPYNFSTDPINLQGGSIKSQGPASLSFSKCSFSKNFCTGHGGSMHLTGDFSLTMSNSSFDGNYCFGEGGALHLSDTSGNIKIDDTGFIANSGSSGGALFFKNISKLFLEDSNFEKNIAIKNGGAVILEDSGSADIDRSIFISNSAGEEGGSLFIQCVRYSRCNAQVTNTSFNSNMVGSSSISISSINEISFLHKERQCKNSITNVRSTCGGAISASGTGQELAIKFSKFFNNTGEEGGAVDIKSLNGVYIENSEFDKNEAEMGGSLYMDKFGNVNSSLIIRESSFKNNSACKGGALVYFNNKVKSGSTRLVMINNRFIKNTAALSGGILHTNKNSSIYICCNCTSSKSSLSNDTAISEDLRNYINLSDIAIDNFLCSDKIVGNDVGQNGYGSKFSTDTSSREISPDVIEDYKSGELFPVLKIRNLDAFGQLIPEYGLFANIKGNLNITGQDTVSMFTGQAKFETMRIYAESGNYKLQLSFSNADYDILYIPITIRSCIPGEIYNRATKTCDTCPSEFYSFSPDDLQCHSCPLHATCNESVIVPKDGYWHSDIDSEFTKKCLLGSVCKWSGRKAILQEYVVNYLRNSSHITGLRRLAQSLAADTTYGSYSYDLQCREGYHGPLCGACNPLHSRQSGYKCIKCQNKILPAISFFFLGLLLLLYSAFLMISSWRIGKKKDALAQSLGYESGFGWESYNEAENDDDQYDSPVMSKTEPNIGQGVAEPQIDSQKSLELIVIHHQKRPSLSPRIPISADSGEPSDIISPRYNPSHRWSRDLSKPSTSSEIEIKSEELVIKYPSKETRHKSHDPFEFSLIKDSVWEGGVKEQVRRTYLPEAFKVMLNFVQVTSMTVFINTDYSPVIYGIYQIFDYIGIGGDSSFSIECLFLSNSNIVKEQLSAAIKRYVLLCLYPALIICIFMFLWIFSSILVHHSYTYMLQRYSHTFFVVLYIIYLNVTHRALRIFACTRILAATDNHSEDVWLEDTDTVCYQGSHKILAYALGLPILLLITLAYPIVAFIASFMRERLRTMHGFRQYGFLTDAYRYSTRYWEIVIFFRKAIIAAIVAFGYFLGPDLQALLAAGVLAFCLLAHLLISPFKKAAYLISNMETVSLFGSFITFYSTAVARNSKVDKNTRDALFITLSVILLCILLYFLHQTITELSATLSGTLARFGVKVDDDARLATKLKLALKLEASRVSKRCRGIARNFTKCLSHNFSTTP